MCFLYFPYKVFWQKAEYFPNSKGRETFERKQQKTNDRIHGRLHITEKLTVLKWHYLLICYKHSAWAVCAIIIIPMTNDYHTAELNFLPFINGSLLTSHSYILWAQLLLWVWHLTIIQELFFFDRIRLIHIKMTSHFHIPNAHCLYNSSYIIILHKKDARHGI